MMLAYHFQGAVTVAELLSSTALTQAAGRALRRLKGEDLQDDDDEMALMLADRAEIL